MKQKRILYISNMYPGNLSRTFGIFVKGHVDVLRRRGFNVDVAAVSDPRMGKQHVIKKYLKWALTIGGKFLSKGRKYQVVHAHYVFPSGLFAMAFKKLFGTRMVVTAHGGDIDRMANKNPTIRKLTGQILQTADEIIAVGDGLKKDICEPFAIPEDKVSVINMGVNRDIFSPMPVNQSRRQESINDDAPVILYVGNIIKAKGLDELIEAFARLKKQLPDAECHLVGQPKKETYLSELKQKINDKGIKDIHFHGAKPQSEVTQLMAAADVLALPSYMEGFGLVALEAMSCHLPVVGSDVGGLSKLLEDDHGRLVQSKNVDSLYHGLYQVLMDDKYRNTLIHNGEEKAKTYDQETMVDQILALYFPSGVNEDEKRG